MTAHSSKWDQTSQAGHRPRRCARKVRSHVAETIPEWMVNPRKRHVPTRLARHHSREETGMVLVLDPEITSGLFSKRDMIKDLHPFATRRGQRSSPEIVRGQRFEMLSAGSSPTPQWALFDVIYVLVNLYIYSRLCHNPYLSVDSPGYGVVESMFYERDIRKK
jgi:hypothetical protein